MPSRILYYTFRFALVISQHTFVLYYLYFYTFVLYKSLQLVIRFL